MKILNLVYTVVYMNFKCTKIRIEIEILDSFHENNDRHDENPMITWNYSILIFDCITTRNMSILVR